MSSSSDESTTQSRSAKSIKISRSKDFNNWKIRTIANASASGLTKYLLTDQTVVTEDELDDLQAEWNAFNPRTEAQEYRIAQVEYKKAKMGIVFTCEPCSLALSPARARFRVLSAL